MNNSISFENSKQDTNEINYESLFDLKTPESLNTDNEILIKKIEHSVVQNIFSSQLSSPPPLQKMDEKKEGRRIKNKLYAKRARETHKTKVESLEYQAKILSLQNQLLLKFCEDLEVGLFPNRLPSLSSELRNTFTISNSNAINESHQKINEFQTLIFAGLNERAASSQNVNQKLELENNEFKEKLQNIISECSPGVEL